RLLADLDRRRAVLGYHRDGGHHDHGGVALHEHVLEEVGHREAVMRVGVAALRLREPLPEERPLAAGRIELVVEEVALDVEDDLLTAEGISGCGRLGRRLLRDREASSGLATLAARPLLRARV